MATKETRRGGEGKLVLPSSLSHSPLGICIEFRKKGFPPPFLAAAAGAARSTEEGREECALCKTRDYSHRTLSQSFSPSGWHHWHGGGHRKARRRRRRTQQPAHPFLPPSLLCLSKDFVVVLYRFSRRQRMCTRHDATPVPLPICPPSLNRSLFSSVGDMRAGERASEHRVSERSSERVAPPGPTRSASAVSAAAAVQ